LNPGHPLYSLVTIANLHYLQYLEYAPPSAVAPVTFVFHPSITKLNCDWNKWVHTAVR